MKNFKLKDALWFADADEENVNILTFVNVKKDRHGEDRKGRDIYKQKELVVCTIGADLFDLLFEKE